LPRDRIDHGGAASGQQQRCEQEAGEFEIHGVPVSGDAAF
jgi:hypothetical protein